MNWITYVIVGIALIGGTFWARSVSRKRRRSKAHLNVQLILDPEQTLTGKISPHIQAASCYDGERLWEEIGGFTGLAIMMRDSGTALTFALDLKEEHKEDAAYPCKTIRSEAVYLRIVVVLCMCEALAKRFVPVLPRVALLSCAELYCDLIDNVRQASSILAG